MTSFEIRRFFVNLSDTDPAVQPYARLQYLRRAVNHAKNHMVMMMMMMITTTMTTMNVLET